MDRADRGEEPDASFLQSIRAAESEGEANLVRILVTSAPLDWSAAALLERRYQPRWKKHEQVEAMLTAKLDEDLERRLLKGRELNAKGLKA